MSIVKSLSVGEGDMFYIRHGVASFTIIDCCMQDEDRRHIVKELQSHIADEDVVRFISTHPDDDHIKNLTYLFDRIEIPNFYCVKNEASKEDETEDFQRYCTLRDSDKAYYLAQGCRRRWLNEGSNERGGAGIHILWPITTNQHYREALARAREGENPNNICPIISYNLKGGATIVWMGDLESEFMNNIKDVIPIDAIDILFAPHHGRDSGKVPTQWLEKMQPKLIIIGKAPSEYLDYYQGYQTITQNSAGDIVFECVSEETHIYVSSREYSVDFLDYEDKANRYGTYIGTLKVGD